MNIQNLQVLLKVIELGNLTKTAQATGYTQSAITHILNSIERELNVVLLSRDHSGAQVTAEGARVMPYIRNIVNDYRELNNIVADIRELKSGTIRIGSFTSISIHWLPGIFNTFKTLYPDINFELLHGNYAEIEAWILQGRVDCGFTIAHNRSEIQNILLTEDRLMVLLPQGHLLEAQKTISPESIIREPFILVEEGKERIVKKFFDDRKYRLNVRYTAVDDHAIIAMVESGLGISVLPELLLYRSHSDVIIRPLETTFRRKLSLSYKKGYDLSPATKCFIAHVQSWVAENMVLQP